MKHVSIFSDGSARGNPGNGGFGTLLIFETPDGTKHEKELSDGYRLTTNNRMELLGVISGLEALKEPCDVVVTTDSQYIANAFNQHWIDGWIKKNWKGAGNKPVKNVDLWQRMLAAMEPHQVTFKWVRGHAGHPENERCDTLATTAADSSDLKTDEEYEREHNEKLL